MTDDEPIGKYLPPLTELQHLGFVIGSALKCNSSARRYDALEGQAVEVKSYVKTFYRKTVKKPIPYTSCAYPQRDRVWMLAISKTWQNLHASSAQLMKLPDSEREMGCDPIAKRIFGEHPINADPYQALRKPARELIKDVALSQVLWLVNNAAGDYTDFDHKTDALDLFAKECWSEGTYFINPLRLGMFLSPDDLVKLRNKGYRLYRNRGTW